MIKKRLVLMRPLLAIGFLLAVVLIPPAVRGNEISGNAGQPAMSGTAITRNDETGLVFDLLVPPAAIDELGSVTAVGLDATIGAPGAPALPYYTTYIAIPPAATYSIAIEEVESTQLDAGFIQPAATRSLQIAEDVSTVELADVADALYEPAPSFVPDPQIYERNAYYPEQAYTFGDELLASGLRLVKLDLFPLQYNAVQDKLHQSLHLVVSIQFEGAVVGEAADHNDTASDDFWRDHVLNYPPDSWREQADFEKTAVNMTLPIGAKTCKIEVDQDGLYAVKGSELGCLGNIAGVDPNKLQLMHRGQAVSYQFVNKDGTAGFGANDEVRFYGWAFDGSRYEDMYFSDNVYWMWAGGDGPEVTSVANRPGEFANRPYFTESITKWPHTVQFSGWEIEWDENEATPWQWIRLDVPKGGSKSVNLPIDLPNPAVSSGQNASVLVEFTSRYTSLRSAPTEYTAVMTVNGQATPTWQKSWNNADNVNAENQAVPASKLLAPGQSGYPENQVNATVSAVSTNATASTYVTRVTVEYPRELVAVDDQLIFGREQAGSSEFNVSGFSAAGANAAVVWDISDRYAPVVINMQTTQVAKNAADATLTIGRVHGANAQFIATTTSNIKSAKSISGYVPVSLTPPDNEAMWLAISHESLMPAAEALADYRRTRSSMSSWAVDVEDIVNQVGYGFNTPKQIQAFLKSAMSNWAVPPQYLTLFGDATIDPRLLLCPTYCDPTLLPTDLLFVDRFNGLIPIDYTYSLLVGDDLNPDLALGRVPARTLAEAQAVVNKIKKYEENLVPAEPWQENMLFVADNDDGGGFFCDESKKTAEHVPDTIAKDFLCLEVGDQSETDDLRAAMFDKINDPGMSFLNYRGHGAKRRWANPSILHTDDVPSWQNVDRPLIVISADCLDGYFAATDVQGLGETFVRLDNNRGSVAHWSSSGLGFTYEHSVLHNAFYDAIFEENYGNLGDIVNYAKQVYLALGYDESEAFSFTLLGDPAMAVYPSSASLPVVLGLTNFGVVD